MRRSIFALALLGTISAPVLAHEKGAIYLAAKEIRVGGELVLRGERLPKSSTLRLQLRGTLETFPLSEVRTTATGTFQARMALPLEARTGAYTVVVLASDGDVAAQATLNVIAAPVVAGGEMSPEQHAMMNTAAAATDSLHASAEMMHVQVATTGAEWAGIVAILLLSAGGGLALLVGALRSRV